jgi:hypothetical protein
MASSRRVEADSVDVAEKLAVQLVRDDESLRGAVLNAKDDPPMIYVERVFEKSSFAGLRVPGAATPGIRKKMLSTERSAPSNPRTGVRLAHLARALVGAGRSTAGRYGSAVKWLLILWVLLAASTEAGQEWELITVTRGATWEVNEAKGALKQNGKVLEGVLKDKTDGKADYQIRIELNGGHAEATFRFISENDEGTTLTGTYQRPAKPTKTNCPEQIQLMNSYQYLGLARDSCKP